MNTCEQFEVAEVWIFGNSQKIGGAWYHPCAWRFANTESANKAVINSGYLRELPSWCSTGGQIAKGRIKMIGAHRRGRSWDMLIERMEIAEEGGEA